MDRLQKQQLVEELNGSLNDAQTVVIAHYKGLTVDEITELRNKSRELGVNIKVAKNRLTRLALEGTPYGNLTDYLKGQTLLAWSDSDPVSPAKAIQNFAKTNNKLVIVGGAMGADVLDVAGVTALAAIPSLLELRAKLVGTLQAPAKKLAMVCKAYGEKEDAA